MPVAGFDTDEELTMEDDSESGSSTDDSWGSAPDLTEALGFDVGIGGHAVPDTDSEGEDLALKCVKPPVRGNACSDPCLLSNHCDMKMTADFKC